jgi:formate hydrogenlyase subunit 6/NADH:ubiquinone oxidoreductase subunit I
MEESSMQLTWLVRGLSTGIVTTRYPRDAEALPAGFRGMPRLEEVACQASEGCDACAQACLPGAIAVNRSGAEQAEFRLNYGACIMCGLCVGACPSGAMSTSPDFELATVTAEDLVYLGQLSLGGIDATSADRSAT